MEDWDLHAVVRGCCSSSSSSTTTIGTTTTTTTSIFGTNQSSDFSWFPPLDLQQQQEYDNNNNSLFTFPDLFSSNSTTLEDLEQLCKPFLPPVNLSIPIPTSSSIALPPVLQQHQHQNHQQQQQRTEQLQQQHRRPLTSPTPASTPRPKRRKNQQKRTVCQVPAEGLSSDMWAWRKYGQKPIKGSPYPRGYYRCSSSKGCLARKQVERSRSDPSMFIITYTAEHNHPVPTHRNSLAGSTRHKASSTTTTTTTTTPNNNKPCASSSPTTELSPTTGLSPTTPLSIEEGGKEDEEEVEGMERVVEEEDEDEFQIPEGLMSDDLFMELDELVVPSTHSNPTTSSSQFPASFSWIAAAGGS